MSLWNENRSKIRLHFLGSSELFLWGKTSIQIGVWLCLWFQNYTIVYGALAFWKRAQHWQFQIEEKKRRKSSPVIVESNKLYCFSSINWKILLSQAKINFFFIVSFRQRSKKKKIKSSVIRLPSVFHTGLWRLLKSVKAVPLHPLKGLGVTWGHQACLTQVAGKLHLQDALQTVWGHRGLAGWRCGGLVSPASRHPAAHGFSSTAYVDWEQSQGDSTILINLLSASICHTERAVAAFLELLMSHHYCQSVFLTEWEQIPGSGSIFRRTCVPCCFLLQLYILCFCVSVCVRGWDLLLGLCTGTLWFYR